jgi:hypothetical protein
MAGAGGGRRGSAAFRACRGGREGHPGRQVDGRGGRVPGPHLPQRPARGGGRGRRGGRHGGPGGGVPNAAAPGGGPVPAPLSPVASVPGVPAPGAAGGTTD